MRNVKYNKINQKLIFYSRLDKISYVKLYFIIGRKKQHMDTTNKLFEELRLSQARR